MIQRGGTIQDAGVAWPARCFFTQLGTFFGNVFRILFCWSDLK
jgi:hypothetical protein